MVCGNSPWCEPNERCCCDKWEHYQKWEKMTVGEILLKAKEFAEEILVKCPCENGDCRCCDINCNLIDYLEQGISKCKKTL